MLSILLLFVLSLEEDIVMNPPDWTTHCSSLSSACLTACRLWKRKKVFLFVLLLQQKPPISEIIAIVDWCEPYILAEGDLPPHLWHNARACARCSRGVFFFFSPVCVIEIYPSVSRLIFGLYGLLLFIQYSALICAAERAAVIPCRVGHVMHNRILFDYCGC